eukprot:m.336755 g.336755  ORF g.336755 m.336755 type:complete len:80 (-) comp19798_c0_seq7:1933-2172(-)
MKDELVKERHRAAQTLRQNAATAKNIATLEAALKATEDQQKRHEAALAEENDRVQALEKRLKQYKVACVTAEGEGWLVS